MLTMMSLGPFTFQLPSIVFQKLSHRREARIAANARVGAGDAFQFIGPGPETISLSGVTAFGINRAGSSYAALNDLMQAGGDYPLIDGLGNVFGQYVLLNFDIDKENFTGLGQARRTEYSLELERVDDPGAAVSNGLLDTALDFIEQKTGHRLSIYSLPGISFP